MQYEYILLFLELLQLFFFLNKKRRNPLVVCNSSFQLLLAFGVVFYISNDFYEYYLVLYPLLVWALLNFVINYSICGPINLDVSPVSRSRLFKWIFILYVFFTVLVIFIKSSEAVQALNSGDFAMMYKEAREDDYKFHSNIFEQIAINFANYLYVPAVLYGFCLISSRKVFRGALICAVVFLHKLVWSTAYSSRADLFAVVVLFVMLLFIFKKYMNASIFKKISRLSLLAVSAAVIVVVYISLSRFDGWILKDMLLLYFGRSPLTFLDHVYSIKTYGDGYVFFSYLKDILPYDTHEPTYLRDTGYNFVPELGRLYDDFGWWFFPLLLMPICLILKRFLKRKCLSFAESYVVFSAFMIFFIGNLYKTADFITLLMVGLIYFIFKIPNIKSSNNTSI